MSKTARLFQLMQALRQAPPPATAQDLAQTLGVSDRTIYRDIEELRSLGAVIDGASGFGYTLIEDAALPPLAFDDEELEALVIGLREVEAVGDSALAQAASSAMVKLRARLPDRQSHRLRHAVLTARRFARPSEPDIDVRALRQATWDELEISFDYSDKSGNASHRAVRPLSITWFETSHCLLAYCLLRQDFRAFRLDQIRDLKISKQSFRPQRIPLLRAYMEAIFSEKAKSANTRKW